MTNELIFKDYFEAEKAIVCQIKKTLPELKEVYTPFSLSDMVESSQASPAVHVIYVGDNVKSAEAGQGSAKMIGQKWLVVLAVRNAKSQLQNTTEIRNLAGELIPKLLGCLQGWKPTDASRALVRIAGAPPPGYSSAFAYFPFMFEGTIIT